MNFDVSYPASDFYQVAVVAHSDNGSCIWWQVRHFSGNPPVAAGEARAALEGVFMAREHGWTEIELEGDCAQVTLAIRDQVTDSFLPFGSLVEAILQASSSFMFFCVFMLSVHVIDSLMLLLIYHCYLRMFWKLLLYPPVWLQ